MRNLYLRYLLMASTILLIVLYLGIAFDQASAQDDVVADLTARLSQQNIPVKKIEVISRVPFRVEVTLQSTSKRGADIPDDPIFTQVVQREITLAQKRGIKFDSAKVIVVNAEGAPIYWAEGPVRPIINVPTVTSQIDDETISRAIRDQIPLNEMTLDSLNISKNADGDKSLNIRLSALNIQVANSAIPQFMPNLLRLVDKLNTDQAARIIVLRVDLIDSKGQILLKYSKDYLLKQTNWYQVDGFTQDWFPRPPTPSRP